jgi:four helix bundle protein
MAIKTHKDLIAWQVGYELAKEIYSLTKKFPNGEQYGYISQMRKSSLSIPSNIAEGCRRQSKAEFHHFCHIAFGSAAELETQLEIARDVGLAPCENFTRSLELVDRSLRLLNGLCRSTK